MQVHGGWRVAGLAALGIGAAAALAACTGRKADDGPMGDLTTSLIQQLKPGWRSGALDVASDAVAVVRRDNGSIQGTYDGTRLLQAADAHAYGTPAIGTPAADVQGDGKATFNEVRQVVRAFDEDSSGSWSGAESSAFEQAVGIRWIPGESISEW
jgi:hypothetical protein